MSGRIGVIGGGLGGLAAACTLAARGREVVLFERNNWLGGKAAVHHEAGYRFDMGPTILTMPSILNRLFAEAGCDLAQRLDLVRLDPQWRCFFTGKNPFDLVEDVEEMADRCEAFAPGTGRGYREFMNLSRRLNGVAERNFFDRPIGSLSDLLLQRSASAPTLLADLIRMRPGRSVAATVRRHISDPQLAQVLDHFTQYIGSSPEASPAILCGIAHMQTAEGVWYPRGGIGTIPAALEQLARELGVQFRLGEQVERIRLNARGQAIGISLANGGDEFFASVVSNMDVVRTHRELLGGKPMRRFDRRRRYEPACSGVVLYLGLDRRYEQLSHHNFVFSDDAHKEFSSIYERGEPAADPTCYVCAPARTDSTVAPIDGEALYILVHTPYLRPGDDWEKRLAGYRRVILDKLERTAGLEGLSRHIRVERRLTPIDIRDRYQTWKGAIYGLASHGRFTGAFKPSNRSPDVPGLYLAGGSAHPGPGMPMALMSGWIAADALHRDLQANGTVHREVVANHA